MPPTCLSSQLVFFFQTDDAIVPSIGYIISGKLAREHSAETLAKRPKYKLDSDQHHVLLRSLQKNDPTAELKNPKQPNVPPGYDNFNQRMLVGIKLIIPRSTGIHEDARSFFGIHYKDKTTTVFVRKVIHPNTKRTKSDLEFTEIPPSMYKTWTFNWQYVLKYACGLN